MQELLVILGLSPVGFQGYLLVSISSLSRHLVWADVMMFASDLCLVCSCFHFCLCFFCWFDYGATCWFELGIVAFLVLLVLSGIHRFFGKFYGSFSNSFAQF